MAARTATSSPALPDERLGVAVPGVGVAGRPASVPVRPLRDSSLFIPVPAAEPVVGEWREQYDRTAPVGFPAHVTLLYPFLPPNLIDVEVVCRLRDLAAEVPPFSFTLSGVCGFRNLVWFSPEPADPFVELTRRLRELYPELPPYGDATRVVPPHLTVARSTDVGFLHDVTAALMPALPVDAVAEEVWLLVQASPKWELHSRLPLGGAS